MNSVHDQDTPLVSVIIGFCKGNNIGARVAASRYLLFLNSDPWTERDCLEKLCAEVELQHADAATPPVVAYDDNSFERAGAARLDFFGITNSIHAVTIITEICAAPGCSRCRSAFWISRLLHWKPLLKFDVPIIEAH